MIVRLRFPPYSFVVSLTDKISLRVNFFFLCENVCGLLAHFSIQFFFYKHRFGFGQFHDFIQSSFYFLSFKFH